jgi:hypothetical protein
VKYIQISITIYQLSWNETFSQIEEYVIIITVNRSRQNESSAEKKNKAIPVTGRGGP